ncbi:MAG: exo-alpha-sialidase [Pirellulales bacterium]
MPTRLSLVLRSFAASVLLLTTATQSARALEPIRYHHPGLTVRLGVGLWAFPMPIDYDEDGDLDLLVACNDKPSGGIYFFENRGRGLKGGQDGNMPIFRPGVRVGDDRRYLRISYVEGHPRVLFPGHELVDFRANGFSRSEAIYRTSKIHPTDVRVRAKQWQYADYDGDGHADLIVGVGDWSTYGWDNAYNAQGEWQNGRLHGYVYWIRNRGTNAKPDYEPPRRVEAGGADVDVFGWPSPSFADFDGDGDLDLICGEFLDQFTYFENHGSRTEPRYAAGRRLVHRGRPIHMELQMIVPTAIDWDGDGDVDLIVGEEDGSVALVEHTGQIIDGRPHFLPPKYFQQEADTLMFGALATPFAFDWDGDGDQDLLCGNTAGQIGLFENLGEAVRTDSSSSSGVAEVGPAAARKWSGPRLLETASGPIHLQAGPNGSIQGPCEAKWGYTTLSVADWDGDNLPDLLVNSIWGEIIWYRNVGTRRQPKLAEARAVEVAWPSAPPKPKWFWWDPTEKQLVTQWRTTPVAVDFTGDGRTDLVMLDTEGYLSLLERRQAGDHLELLPPRRAFVDRAGNPIRLNARTAGGSGRRKLAVADWDGDGRLDLLVNSSSADWWRNEGNRGDHIVLDPRGPLAKQNVAGHTTSPAVSDFDRDGRPDLIVGAEDGRLYYLAHQHAMSYPDAAEEGSQAGAKKDLPAKEGLAARPGVVLVEDLFTDPPFRRCHASTIAQTTSGLVAAWFGGPHEGHHDVGIWVSRFDGEHWTGPVEVADGVQHTSLRYPCWNPVLYQVAEGPLLLFYKCGPNPREWWGMWMKSHDGGRLWQETCRLPEQIAGPIKNKPIRLSDGTLLSGSSTEEDGWRVHVERTTDLGQTWTRIGPIDDPDGVNAIQPSLLVHRDGRLQLLCRSKSGQLVTSWSGDRGANWSPLKKTRLPNPNSGTDAVTLSNGRQLLVYNHTRRDEGIPRGRQMLNVAISDDGIDWQAALVLEKELGEFSYPAVIQSDDGQVHITYTWHRKRVRHVVLDPAKLELRPMPDGRWPGI